MLPLKRISFIRDQKPFPLRPATVSSVSRAEARLSGRRNRYNQFVHPAAGRFRWNLTQSLRFATRGCRNRSLGGPHVVVSGDFHRSDHKWTDERVRSSSRSNPEKSQGDLKMKWTTLAAALAIVFSANFADAGLFGHHKSSDCCAPAPSCCAPCDPGCACPCDPGCAAPCGPACAPACCAPEAPACCAPCDPGCAAPCGPACEPACAAPCGPACDPGCAAPCGPACEPACAAPCGPACAPSCCAPAPAQCCAPAKRSCCGSGGGMFGWFKKLCGGGRGCCSKSNCCAPAPSCCAPSNCAPTCAAPCGACN